MAGPIEQFEIKPIIVPIEIVSCFSRPVSHSVRLFAVMLAGHITLKVFDAAAVCENDPHNTRLIK